MRRNKSYRILTQGDTEAPETVTIDITSSTVNERYIRGRRAHKVMDLSGSQNNDFFDRPQDDHSGGASGSQNNLFFDRPQDELSGGGKKDEILPSYDFQPIRPVGASQSINLEGSTVGGTRVWNSADSKTNTSSTRNYGSLDPYEYAKSTQEKERNAYDAATVSEIEQTMKKHSDTLLHALEGVSARLSQLESRTRHLESTVDDLKVSVGNNHGNTDGKLRQLENILGEPLSCYSTLKIQILLKKIHFQVQTGVQVLRDKQEIAEAQLQLAKLQVSKGDQQSENQNSVVHTDYVQQVASAPQQSHQQIAPPVALPQQLPALPPPNAPPPPPQQTPLPQVQLAPQLPQNQIPSIPQREPYFPLPGQTPEATHQQYQLPPLQQTQPPPPAPHQHYQPPPPQLLQYSQPPQQHQSLGPVNPPPQLQPPLGHHPEETPYMPSQTYPPTRQPPSMTQPPSGVPPSQQIYAAAPHLYEPPPSRPSSGFSGGYGPPPGSNFNDSYPYSGSPSHYGSSTMKPSQFSSSPAPSSGNNYPRLPTAQILPRALPTASSVGSGSSSEGTGNRVPIDDVVDNVTTMGFPRDVVRATVRKLTENGQSVDLNVVLDKLMNDGEVQPQKGWFNR
ncbi:hypothetical protein HHK36_024997 [Tetracentron sinense]|uniref:DUF1421 domain-containing protein n=1 Tax=Tetracentron sinense TaxID=13715 RepID=A0A834YRT5_TETSI|nr:hypothetical protein HHK36_024997 [Tetracentron sinense]